MKKLLTSLLLASTASAQVIGGAATISGAGAAGTPSGTLAITLVGSATATDTTIVLWTGNFPSPNYQMYYATLTIN